MGLKGHTWPRVGHPLHPQPCGPPRPRFTPTLPTLPTTVAPSRWPHRTPRGPDLDFPRSQGFHPGKDLNNLQGFPLTVEGPMLTVGSAQRVSNPLGAQSSGRQSGTRTLLPVSSWRGAPPHCAGKGDSTPPGRHLPPPIQPPARLTMLSTCWSPLIPHTSLPREFPGPQSGSDPTSPL